MTLLEKFVSKLGIDFDQIEMEMNLKEEDCYFNNSYSLYGGATVTD